MARWIFRISRSGADRGHWPRLRGRCILDFPAVDAGTRRTGEAKPFQPRHKAVMNGHRWFGRDSRRSNAQSAAARSAGAVVRTYFGYFQECIDRCRKASDFHAPDWEDAYARLARLRERYRDEKGDLAPFERKALSKVFEEDPFTKGMMQIRQVAEHIEINESFTIRATDNAPLVFGTETTAQAMFSAAVPNLIDIHGEPQRIEHLKMLEEMERRIAKAIATAQR
jgi:hypothetical protein